MKKIWIKIKELLFGKAPVEGSSTDTGKMSKTVFAQAHKETDPPVGSVMKPVVEAIKPEPTKEELPDECYENLAEVKEAASIKADKDTKAIEKKSPKKLWAAAPSRGFFKNGKEKKPLSARETYEKEYGKIITKGMAVIHVDGDKTNFHISNLNVVKKIDIMKRNTKK